MPPNHDHSSRVDIRPPAWRRVTEGEQRWHVGLAVLILVVIQIFAPRAYAFRPAWLVPVLELVLLLAVTVVNPRRVNRQSRALRVLGLGLVVVASWATAWSAAWLGYELITGNGPASPAELIRNGGAIWLTNVIVFALWFWELDRGGPAARANSLSERPDFLFPQMIHPQLAEHDWEPEFVDYLYVSFTNATAFSPTDVMPLSRWVKLSMMFQSSVSLLMVVLVIARAVNVLG